MTGDILRGLIGCETSGVMRRAFAARPMGRICHEGDERMSDPTPQDRDDSFNFTTEVDDLLRRAVLRFGRWMAENWTMSADEARTLTEPTTAPAEYARGYNDAVRQIRHACETWIEGGQE